MSDYEVPPKPAPDMDAGRSASKVSDRMKSGGQDTSDGAMGKSQKTGDMLGDGVHGGSKK